MVTCGLRPWLEASFLMMATTSCFWNVVTVTVRPIRWVLSWPTTYSSGGCPALASDVTDVISAVTTSTPSMVLTTSGLPSAIVAASL